MKVKVGDNVKILAGKDKGKEGRIIKTLKKTNQVVVEGVNVVKKHVKPNRMNEVGSIIEIEKPIHVSNVKLSEEKKSDAKKATTKKVTAKKETTKKEAVKETAKKTTKKKDKES